MRGHEFVLQMRRAGVIPAACWLDDTGCRTCLPERWPEGTAHAQVEIEPTENPRRLDLRFAAGMTLWVSSRSSERLHQIAEQAELCGVDRVLGAIYEGEGVQMKLTAMTDTKGVLQWQS